MVATPNLFLKSVLFFGSSSRRDSGCDTKYSWTQAERCEFLEPVIVQEIWFVGKYLRLVL